jgi:hypothetical protein
MRLIRDAFAVRERLGDPRVVPSFRFPFLPDMPSPRGPRGDRNRTPPVYLRFRHWPSPRSVRLGSPVYPAIRFKQGTHFGAYWFAFATACPVARPSDGSDRDLSQPTGAFTSRLSMNRSPSSLLDITTTATGPLLSMGLSPIGMVAILAAPDPPRARPCAPDACARPSSLQSAHPRPPGSSTPYSTCASRACDPTAPSLPASASRSPTPLPNPAETPLLASAELSVLSGLQWVSPSPVPIREEQIKLLRLWA